MAELARRTPIREMRRAGSSVSDIFKSTGYAKSTVYRVVATFVPVLTSAGLGMTSTSFSAQQGMFWFSFDHCRDCVDFSKPYPRHQKQKQLDKQSISHSQCSQ